MIVCGLKLTHDGAVALLDGDRLVFSVEMEKLANNPRYSSVADLDVIPRVLAEHGYAVTDVDEWVIDGWDGRTGGSASPANFGQPVEIAVAAYREQGLEDDLLRPGHSGKFPLGGEHLPYASFPHVTGHLASAYCTSPFAARGEPAFVLVWDGGLFPRLYHADPAAGVRNHGALFPLVGHAYATAAHHFGPFRRADESRTVDDLSVAGKLMAYIALGAPLSDVLKVLRTTFHDHFESDGPAAERYRATIGGWGSNAEPSLEYVHAFYRQVRAQVRSLDVEDADILASVHEFLGDLLVRRLSARVAEVAGAGPHNLCFVGGCALNIKWNSALRADPAFVDVWVPPFPNDSGSAIGAAAARRGLVPITWHVRSGPALLPTPAPPDGWTATPCTPAELAGVLHREGDPVIVLNGRAELGPRALGGRSILAAATSGAMKDLLNGIKHREPYRPVAPLCLVELAPEVFAPGTPDHYMLFEHTIRPDWIARIPAVRHLDGTARLQTVAPADDPVLHAVLTEYYRLSGVPVLCNTSANHHGTGFFPDVASAATIGIPTIWSEGTLYRRGDQ